MPKTITVPIKSLSAPMQRMARLLAKDCSDIVIKGMVKIDAAHKVNPKLAKALYDSVGNKIEL